MSDAATVSETTTTTTTTVSEKMMTTTTVSDATTVSEKMTMTTTVSDAMTVGVVDAVGVVEAANCNLTNTSIDLMSGCGLFFTFDSVDDEFA